MHLKHCQHVVLFELKIQGFISASVLLGVCVCVDTFLYNIHNIYKFSFYSFTLLSQSPFFPGIQPSNAVASTGLNTTVSSSISSMTWLPKVV